MCWSCDMDQAKALLIDAQLVLNEAKTLRKHGNQMKAQAFGEKYRAELRCADEPDLCTEEKDDD